MTKWILIFLLVSCPLCAEVHGYLQLDKAVDSQIAIAETEVQLWLGKGDLKNELYGGWQTWLLSNNLRGYPFRDMYWLGNRLHYKRYYLEINHYCVHEVYSVYNDPDIINTYLDKESLTTVGIGVQW